MKDINKIIDSLSPVEQNLMYNALQKKLNRGPEYTIGTNRHGYYINSNNGSFRACRFEKKEYAELAYQVYKNMNPSEHLIYTIRSVFRLLNIDSEWAKQCYR